MTKLAKLNAKYLELELLWLSKVLDTRFKLYFGQESTAQSIFEIKPPRLTTTNAPYIQTIRKYKMSFAERLVLILGLVPHIRPALLDMFFTKNSSFDRPFSVFGGHVSDVAFIPTGETALFILAGSDLEAQFNLRKLFTEDHFFYKDQFFDFQKNDAQMHLVKSPLLLTDSYLHLFTFGGAAQEEIGKQFLIQFAVSDLNSDSLGLAQTTIAEIKELENRIINTPVLINDWEMAGKLWPGVRALFHGPPGTGKTIAAKFIGNSTGFEVYRVDLSALVSKYIGETEKNLSRVFEKASRNKWILFFDEADSLFGKRTQVDNSNDRFANQEVSYLLQRIENFDGVVILSLSSKGNLDDAFLRRFDAIVHFPLPTAQQRLQIWTKNFSPKAKLEPSVDLKDLAEKFELSGGAIMNVITYASLKALGRNTNVIPLRDLIEGIRREIKKQGKII